MDIPIDIYPDGLRFGSFNLNETSDYLSFYFWEVPRRFNRHWCLYNKVTGQTFYTNVNLDFDDLFGDIDPPQIKAATKDMFCFAVDSYKLLERWDKKLVNFASNKPESLEQLKSLREGLTNNSNPVLVFMSVKEH